MTAFVRPSHRPNLRLQLLALCLLTTSCHPAPQPVPVPVQFPAPPDFTACTTDPSADVLDHDISLTLRLDPPALTGQGDIRLKTTTLTTTVLLDAVHLDIQSLSLAGQSLPHQERDGQVCAVLPHPVPPGTELSLHIDWTVATDAQTPHFTASDVWAGYGTSHWMPTRFESGQRATLHLRILADPSLTVAASGRRITPTATTESARAPSGSPSLTEHTFVLDRPTPPFLYAFAAGHFEQATLLADGVLLRALGPVGADLHEALSITATSLHFMIEHTGVPFPAAEYTQVFVQGDAAQESAGMSILSADSLNDVRKDPHEDWIFTHELAHQWFGWSISCADFSDFWLNEGFATFFVAAAKEQRWGRPAYDREVALWRERSANVHAAGKDAPVSTPALDPPPPGRVLDAHLPPRGVTYSRGALVLAKLRADLGDTSFWNGIRQYATDRAGKSAHSSDLRAAFEKASGRDLHPFFTTWVFTSAPALSSE